MRDMPKIQGPGRSEGTCLESVPKGGAAQKGVVAKIKAAKTIDHIIKNQNSQSFFEDAFVWVNFYLNKIISL